MIAHIMLHNKLIYRKCCRDFVLMSGWVNGFVSIQYNGSMYMLNIISERIKHLVMAQSTANCNRVKNVNKYYEMRLKEI